MILFRHLSLRERWNHYRPTRGEAVALVLGCAASLLVFDVLTGSTLERALSEARRELATAKCVERSAHAGDSSARREKLRSLCAARTAGAP